MNRSRSQNGHEFYSECDHTDEYSYKNSKGTKQRNAAKSMSIRLVLLTLLAVLTLLTFKSVGTEEYLRGFQKSPSQFSDTVHNTRSVTEVDNDATADITKYTTTDAFANQQQLANALATGQTTNENGQESNNDNDNGNGDNTKQEAQIKKRFQVVDPEK